MRSFHSMNQGTNNFTIINGKEYFIEWSFNDNGKIKVEIIKKLSFEDIKQKNL